MSHPAADFCLTPHLVCADAAEGIGFYERAFGAREVYRLNGPDGKTIMHSCVEIGGGRIFVVDENPQAQGHTRDAQSARARCGRAFCPGDRGGRPGENATRRHVLG